MDKKNIASEQTPEEKKEQGASPSLLPKLKKRKKTPSQIAENVQRYAPLAEEGLTSKQVEERIEQGLVNKSGK